MTDFGSVRGKTVFITDGGASLGRGFARRFALSRSHVAPSERLAAVAKEVRSRGGRASVREVDICAGRSGTAKEGVGSGFFLRTPAADCIGGGEWLNAKAATA